MNINGDKFPDQDIGSMMVKLYLRSVREKKMKVRLIKQFIRASVLSMGICVSFFTNAADIFLNCKTESTITYDFVINLDNGKYNQTMKNPDRGITQVWSGEVTATSTELHLRYWDSNFNYWHDWRLNRSSLILYSDEHGEKEKNNPYAQCEVVEPPKGNKI